MSPSETSFTQKAYKKEINLVFSEDKLNYDMRDSSGEKAFSVPYESINLKDPSLLVIKDVQRPRRIFLYIFMLVLSVAFLSLRDQSEDNLKTAYLILSIVFLAISFGINLLMRRKSIRYQIFQTSQKGPLHFIENEDYPAIQKELNQRWTARAKKLYGTINFLNDIHKEQQKFEWLKHNKIITEEEYQEALSKLKAVHLTQVNTLQDDGPDKPTQIN